MNSLAAPVQLAPDLLAAALDTDWQRLGLEYLARLDALLGREAAALWAAPLALDELRPEAACYRLAMKVWDLEETSG